MEATPNFWTLKSLTLPVLIPHHWIRKQMKPPESSPTIILVFMDHNIKYSWNKLPWSVLKATLYYMCFCCFLFVCFLFFPALFLWLFLACEIYQSISLLLFVKELVSELKYSKFCQFLLLNILNWTTSFLKWF